MGTIYPINTRYPHSFLVAPVVSLLLASFLILYSAYYTTGRWQSYHGVQAEAVITELAEVNRPDGSTFYFLSVDARSTAGKKLRLERRIDAQLFHSLRVNQRQRIRYQPDQPNNFLVQSESWFRRDDGLCILFGLAPLALGIYWLTEWRRNRRLYA